MIKKKFSELKKGDIFYLDWDWDIPGSERLITCMKIEYDEKLPTDEECKWCDYIKNAVWLDYKPGTLDYCPDDLMVWVNEEY